MLLLALQLLGALPRCFFDTLLVKLDSCFRDLYFVQGLEMLLTVDASGLALVQQLAYLHFSVLHLHVDNLLCVLAPELVVVLHLTHRPFFVALGYCYVCLVLRVSYFNLSFLSRLQLFQ